MDLGLGLRSSLRSRRKTQDRCHRERKSRLQKDLRLQKTGLPSSGENRYTTDPFWVRMLLMRSRSEDCRMPCSLPSRGSFVSRIGRWSLCGFRRSGSGTIDVGDCRAAARCCLTGCRRHLLPILPPILPRQPPCPDRPRCRLTTLRVPNSWRRLQAAPAAFRPLRRRVTWERPARRWVVLVPNCPPGHSISTPTANPA